jgi:hypothetical protein
MEKNPYFDHFPAIPLLLSVTGDQGFLYQRFHLPIAISENATMRDKFI